MYVFENLDIYNKAVGLAAIMEDTTEAFPGSTDYFGDRLNRVATSISINIAEAHGHWKDEERREFYWKAREATQECSGLLDIAEKQGLINSRHKISFRDRLESLNRLIQDVIRHTDEKKAPPIPPTANAPVRLKIL